MTSVTQTRSVGSVDDVLARARISQIYAALTGREPRRVSPDRSRAVATWRGGKGLNVSLDDSRGLWYDFTAGEGGGILDLIVRVRGGTRQDALRCAAEIGGCRLDDRPLSSSERRRWAELQQQIRCHLSNARLWRRAALALGEAILESLKAALWDKSLPRPEFGEIAFWTAQLNIWRRLDGGPLVTEYLRWVQNHRLLTAGMVHAGRLRQTANLRALKRFLGIVSSGAAR